jgi:hypothetical protein
MTRTGTIVMAAAVMTLMAGAARAETPAAGARPVRLAQEAAELGLTAGVTAGLDGSLNLVATAGDLTVRKNVQADGRFVVEIARGRGDTIEIAGDAAGVRVRSGREAAVALRADRSDGFEDRARHVRTWLARSEAVQRLRQITAALDLQEAATPEALSLRVTGALVAELSGDVAAAQRFSRAVTARLGQRLRKAQSGGSGYQVTCWDTYSRMVNQAAYQLESCIASFAVYNPMRQICAAVWVLQVESAWFQFLSCSSFPLK